MLALSFCYICVSDLRIVQKGQRNMSATLKNVYAPVPSVTRGKPVHFGAHPKGTHFIYASARNIVIRSVTVSAIAQSKREKSRKKIIFSCVRPF